MALKITAVIVCVMLCSPLFCGASDGEEVPAGLKVSSGAFTDGGEMPRRYAFAHENVSVPIAWSGAPETARSIAIICDDPDAPGKRWVHWVIFNIPVGAQELREGVGRKGILDDGSRQGVNDFKKTGYDGPAPPRGTHRYIFKVFALDSFLDLKPGCTKDELIRAMDGHIVAEGQIMGRYNEKNQVLTKQ